MMNSSVTDRPANPAHVSAASEEEEIVFRIVGSEHDGRMLRIQSPKCTIGSADGCTLRLRARGVQPLHCLVLRGPGGVAVRSWSADTRLNGQAFRDARLAPGDRLSIGPIELDFLPEGGAADGNAREGRQVSDEDEARHEAQHEAQRLAEWEQKSQALAQDRDALAQRLAEREQFVAQLEQNLSVTQQLVEQLREEQAAPPAVAAAPCPETLQEIETLKQQAETLAQQFDVARQSFQTERRNWETERARLAGELEKALATAARDLEKQRSAKELEVALTHWRERAEDLTREVSDLRRQLNELAEQSAAPGEDPRQLRSELEAAARELDAETERLLESEQQLEARRRAWEAEQVRAGEELAAERDRLAALAAELQDRAHTLEQQALAAAAAVVEEAGDTAAVEALRAALAAAHETLTERDTELARQREEIDELTDALADLRGHLAGQAEELAVERQRLAEEFDALARARAELAHSAAPATSAAEPIAAAPTSAAEVIARLSASGLWKDDALAAEEVDEPDAPEPAWKDLVSAEEAAPVPAPVIQEEESIEAYMQRLLQRVSGVSGGVSRPAASHAAAREEHSRPRPESAVASPAEAPRPELEPLNAETYRPRSQAPELSANLAAMRALANSTARGALDSSHQRRKSQYAARKFQMSLAALLVAVMLGWLAWRAQSVLTYYAALAAGLASVLWLARGVYVGLQTLRLERPRPTETKSPPSLAASTADGGLPLGDGLAAVADESLPGELVAAGDEGEDRRGDVLGSADPA